MAAHWSGTRELSRTVGGNHGGVGQYGYLPGLAERLLAAKRFAAVLGLCGVLLTGCGSATSEEGRAGGPETETQAAVRVDNRSTYEVSVYAVRAGQRIRLGTARGTSTTVLPIPDHLLLGTSLLRFQLDPVGGAARTTSDEIPVSPGDEVLIIYP